MSIMIGKQRRIARMIRQAVDSCPDGLCMATTNGRPILVNQSMNKICHRLTGHTIVNALTMWEELQHLASTDMVICDSIAREDHLLLPLPDGTVWQFRRQSRTLDETEVLQMEASDVTELYQYAKQLEENNRNVAELHRRQRELLQSIVQNNLKKELLQAKMQIHDDIGQMLLLTRNELAGEISEQQADALYRGWENVIFDMENAANSSHEKTTLPEEELVRVAGMVGCRVEFHGKQPNERKALMLLYAAIREALTNAVRHAAADVLTIELQELGDMYHAKISSNGNKTPVLPLREGVGLSSLRQRIECEGGTMEIRTDDGVVMVLSIPKE
ncbi:MAG: hypothetical protein IJ744_10445 [Lachnospiraceae bacterium]|nr:hypothetical protein [Lachnospiraceae bacterium]